MKKSLKTNDSSNFKFVHSTSSRLAFPGYLTFGCSENVTGTGKLQKVKELLHNTPPLYLHASRRITHRHATKKENSKTIQ